eukprot:XP_001702285.1 predicted protein [Chlamydomonas reinhardtii]
MFVLDFFGWSGGSSDPNYYELLGLEPDCDEEDIKTAFRRRAKELHPDVNKEDGATESFVRLSRAYEVLSDPEARRQYDIQTSTRRFNFFRDVVEDEDDVRRSPFKWSQVRCGGGGRGSEWDHPRRQWDEEDRRGGGPGRQGGGGGGGGDFRRPFKI